MNGPGEWSNRNQQMNYKPVTPYISQAEYESYSVTEKLMFMRNNVIDLNQRLQALKMLDSVLFREESRLWSLASSRPQAHPTVSYDASGGIQQVSKSDSAFSSFGQVGQSDPSGFTQQQHQQQYYQQHAFAGPEMNRVDYYQDQQSAADHWQSQTYHRPVSQQQLQHWTQVQSLENAVQSIQPQPMRNTPSEMNSPNVGSLTGSANTENVQSGQSGYLAAIQRSDSPFRNDGRDQVLSGNSTVQQSHRTSLEQRRLSQFVQQQQQHHQPSHSVSNMVELPQNQYKPPSPAAPVIYNQLQHQNRMVQPIQRKRVLSQRTMQNASPSVPSISQRPTLSKDQNIVQTTAQFDSQHALPADHQSAQTVRQPAQTIQRSVQTVQQVVYMSPNLRPSPQTSETTGHEMHENGARTRQNHSDGDANSIISRALLTAGYIGPPPSRLYAIRDFSLEELVSHKADAIKKMHSLQRKIIESDNPAALKILQARLMGLQELIYTIGGKLSSAKTENDQRLKFDATPGSEKEGSKLVIPSIPSSPTINTEINPDTVANDILRAVGLHPSKKSLNVDFFAVLQHSNQFSVGRKADLAELMGKIDWNVFDPPNGFNKPKVETASTLKLLDQSQQNLKHDKFTEGNIVPAMHGDAMVSLRNNLDALAAQDEPFVLSEGEVIFTTSSEPGPVILLSDDETAEEQISVIAATEPESETLGSKKPHSEVIVPKEQSISEKAAAKVLTATSPTTELGAQKETDRLANLRNAVEALALQDMAPKSTSKTGMSPALLEIKSTAEEPKTDPSYGDADNQNSFSLQSKETSTEADPVTEQVNSSNLQTVPKFTISDNGKTVGKKEISKSLMQSEETTPSIDSPGSASSVEYVDAEEGWQQAPQSAAIEQQRTRLLPVVRPTGENSAPLSISGIKEVNQPGSVVAEEVRKTTVTTSEPEDDTEKSDLRPPAWNPISAVSQTHSDGKFCMLLIVEVCCADDNHQMLMLESQYLWEKSILSLKQIKRMMVWQSSVSKAFQSSLI